MGLRDQRGISMVEALVAAGSVALIAYTFMSVLDLRAQLLGRVHFSYLLSEVVIANLNEVKTKKREALPKVDECMVRYYTLEPKFLREEMVPVADDRCGKNALAKNEMQVVWRISGPADIHPTFSPSAFLRLPENVASILQVEVQGRVPSPPPGPKEQTFGTVIFRK